MTDYVTVVQAREVTELAVGYFLVMKPHHVAVITLSRRQFDSTYVTISLHRNLFPHIDLELTEYVPHSDVFDSIRPAAKAFLTQITHKGKFA